MYLDRRIYSGKPTNLTVHTWRPIPFPRTLGSLRIIFSPCQRPLRHRCPSRYHYPAASAPQWETRPAAPVAQPPPPVPGVGAAPWCSARLGAAMGRLCPTRRRCQPSPPPPRLSMSPGPRCRRPSPQHRRPIHQRRPSVLGICTAKVFCFFQFCIEFE
jgi:hypothetical protein